MKYQQILWSRSNRANFRLESLYFALGELETALQNWRQIQDLNHPNTEESLAQKALLKAFGKDLTFIDNFLADIAVFRCDLLQAFLK